LNVGLTKCGTLCFTGLNSNQHLLCDSLSIDSKNRLKLSLSLFKKHMISSNINLQPYNTFGIVASAREFAAFDTVEKLHEIVKENSDKALFILGGGSNILLTQNIDALVLRNEIKGITALKSTATQVWVKCGAGDVWHEFVMHCIANNWGGLENLSLIPGSVGASPMQNIGAYGVEIKDVFEELEAYHLETGEVHRFNANQCAFGYRESVFKRDLKGQYVILSVTFRLTVGQHQLKTSYGDIERELQAKGITAPTIRDVSNAVIAIRQSKLPDPKEIGNAGSFFKNPVVPRTVYENILKQYPTAPAYPIDENHVKVPAGWLIETAGWKGKTLDNYGVHKKQALVLVNYGGATGQQIYDLSTAILNDVNHKFGITLEREVNII
jgi:UDP-N-acetylmuramate dehydrogenase